MKSLLFSWFCVVIASVHLILISLLFSIWYLKTNVGLICRFFNVIGVQLILYQTSNSSVGSEVAWACYLYMWYMGFEYSHYLDMVRVIHKQIWSCSSKASAFKMHNTNEINIFDFIYETNITYNTYEICAIFAFLLSSFVLYCRLFFE